MLTLFLLDVICANLLGLDYKPNKVIIQLKSAQLVFLEERQLVPTPEGRFCTDMDLTKVGYANISPCVQQSVGVFTCAKQSADVKMVFQLPSAQTDFVKQ